MNLNIPNCLTGFRIIAVPLIVILYLSDVPYANWYTTGLFIIAAVSDWLDGYLARKWNQVSKLGAFLDPVADKLLVTVLLVLIVADTALMPELFNHTLFLITVTIIVSREIIISALREWMAELGKRNSVAVSFIGKIKATAQMTAIGFFLFKTPLLHIPVLQLGEILLYISGLLTVWSMCVYLSAAYKELKQN